MTAPTLQPPPPPSRLPNTPLIALLATALLGLQGLRAALITLVLIWGLGWALKRTLGGQTGDTLGAAIELGELLFLLALL